MFRRRWFCPSLAAVAMAGINGLLILFVLLALFVVISIIAGIVSWFNYRNEEVDLLDEVQVGFRKRPNLRNFWRWNETYMIGFIIIITVFCMCICGNTNYPIDSLKISNGALLEEMI